MALSKGDQARRDKRNQETRKLREATGGSKYLQARYVTSTQGRDAGTRSIKVSDTDAFKLDTAKAKDPRNWEYWYKDRYGKKAVGGTYTSTAIGAGRQSTKSNQERAIGRAKQDAKEKGEDAWGIMETQREIKEIKAETDELKRVQRESRVWGSTATASRVAQQKMMSRRRGGRSLGRPRAVGTTLG